MTNAKARYGMIFAALLTSSPVQAVFVTGHFSGIAFDSLRNEGLPMYGDFDGAVVTGSFGFDTAAVGTSNFGILTFEVPGIVSYDFSGPMTLSIADDGSQQSIGMEVFPPFAYGTLTLSGPSGSLFTALDLTRFDPQSYVLSDATAMFVSRRGPMASVDIGNLSFDNTVSEPASLALLGMGLAGLSVLGRRTRALRS